MTTEINLEKLSLENRTLVVSNRQTLIQILHKRDGFVIPRLAVDMADKTIIDNLSGLFEMTRDRMGTSHPLTLTMRANLIEITKAVID